MRKCLFLILLFVLVIPISAQTEDAEISMVPFISPPLNVQGIRPEGWIPQQNAEGVFIRGLDPLDLTALITQSQATDKDTFLNSVVTSFQVETDLAVIDNLETDFFTWDIYQFNRMQGEQELIIDMGIAESSEDERIYYVLMQTNAAFYEKLHDEVFIPAMTWLSPIQVYEDPDELFTVSIPVQWNVVETDDFAQLTNLEESIAIFMAAIPGGDDPIATTQAFLATVNPEFDQTFDPETNQLTVLDDPERIGDLEAVYIIYWVDGANEDKFLLQTVTRLYEGIAYITVIVGDVDSILAYETDIALIDNGFQITSMPLSPEATLEPEE